MTSHSSSISAIFGFTFWTRVLTPDIRGAHWLVVNRKDFSSIEFPTNLGNICLKQQLCLSVSDDHELSPPNETESMVNKESDSKTMYVTTNGDGENVSSVENGRLTDSAGTNEDVLKQTSDEKIILNCGTAGLLLTLAVVWIYYR